MFKYDLHSIKWFLLSFSLPVLVPVFYDVSLTLSLVYQWENFCDLSLLKCLPKLVEASLDVPCFERSQ